MEYDTDRLKLVAETFLNAAVFNLKKDKHLLPTAIMVKEGDLRLAPMNWNDDDEKYQLFDAFIRYAREYKPDAAFFVSEAWSKEVAESDPGYDSHKAPSEYPDKKEVVVIMAVSHSSRLSILQSFVRLPNDSIHIEEQGKKFMSDEKGEVVTSFLDPIFDISRSIPTKPVIH